MTHGGFLLPASVLSHLCISMNLLEMLNFKSDIKPQLWSDAVSKYSMVPSRSTYPMLTLYTRHSNSPSIPLAFLEHTIPLLQVSRARWVVLLSCVHTSARCKSLAELVTLARVDMRLWFWRGSEVTPHPLSGACGGNRFM